VGAGQVAVEHHHVVAVDPQPGQGVVAVEGDVDGHTFPAQPDGHGPGEHLVVFGDQDSHLSIMTPKSLHARAGPGQGRHTGASGLSG
jgi:hypothetical protein